MVLKTCIERGKCRRDINRREAHVGMGVKMENAHVSPGPEVP